MTKTISYKLQFIDSARFLSSSLSNLVDNFAQRITNIKCKYGHDNKKCEGSEFNPKILSAVLNTHLLKVI